MNLELVGRRLNVTDEASGEEVGQVESKTASRIKRLMSGGNRYAATVKSVDDRAVTIIIREVYKHPSQAGIVSFPSKASSGAHVSSPAAWGRPPERTRMRWRPSASTPRRTGRMTIPSRGDDEAFSPSIHRIINSASEDF